MIHIILPPEPDLMDVHAAPDQYAVSENQILAIRKEFPQVEASAVKMTRKDFWELFTSCSRGIAGYVKHGHVLYIEGDEAELKELNHELASCRELEVRTAQWLYQAGSKLVPSVEPSCCQGDLTLQTPAFVPGMTRMVVTRKRQNRRRVRRPRTGNPPRR